MFATLHNCVIRNNKAIYQASNQRGGGIIRGSAYNSLIEGNVAGTGGGGWNTILYNCTIVNNTGSSKSSGTYQCTLYNCISWNNVDYENSVAYYSRGDEDLYLTNNCTQADPLFIDAENGDWRLRGSSPCIDTGTNQTWMTTARDLDGRPRLNSAPDMGCYEYWPQATMLIMH